MNKESKKQHEYLKKLINKGFDLMQCRYKMEKRFNMDFSSSKLDHWKRDMKLSTQSNVGKSGAERYEEFKKLRKRGYGLTDIAVLMKANYNTLYHYVQQYNVEMKIKRYDKFVNKQKEKEIVEKVGFLDIECENLDADFGMVLSYCIQDVRGKNYGRVITSRELKNSKIRDKQLMIDCIKDMKRFDRLVVHYGGDKRFDIPFLRSRAYKWGLQKLFPKPKEIVVTDTWLIAKMKFKLHSRSLRSVAEFFGIPNKQHPLSGDKWIDAKQGDPKGLLYVWKHNIEDVTTTRLVYACIQQATHLKDTSI